MIILEIENFRDNATLRSELESFHWGKLRVVPSQREGQGKFIPVDDASLTRVYDGNSPEFFKRALQGPAFPKVTIKLGTSTGRGGFKPYMEIVLSDVMISSYSVGGHHPPMESMTLNFTKGEFRQL